MHQGATAGLGLVDRLLRGDPHRVDRLRPVVQGDLVFRRLGEKEPSVEALGREGGRDPVGVGHHEIGGELEVLRLDQVDDAGLVLGKLGAPALLDAVKIDGGHQGALAARNFSASSSILSAPPQRARKAGSPSASSSLPPGKTRAPEKASIWWW